MLWISGALVVVFGGLTVYFHDPSFIKMKPTFVYLLFSGTLAFGLLTGRPLLEQLLGTAYPGLSAEGWRKVTRNWAIFFVFMALLNEVGLARNRAQSGRSDHVLGRVQAVGRDPADDAVRLRQRADDDEARADGRRRRRRRRRDRANCRRNSAESHTRVTLSRCPAGMSRTSREKSRSATSR